MRKLSMTAILAAALALVGCADGVKELKGEKGILGRKVSPGRQARQERKEKRGRRETLGLPAPRSGWCPHNHRSPRARPTRL